MILRVMRLVRMLKMIKAFYKLLVGVVKSFKGMFWVITPAKPSSSLTLSIEPLLVRRR